MRPVLVGHSLGAGVAAAAGLARPRQVAGVVLVDGDALAFGGNHAWLADLLVYPYYTAVYRIATGSDRIVGRAFRNEWGRSLLPRATPHWRNSSGPSSRLAQLHVERTVIWGAEDNVDSLASGRSTAAVLHTHLRIVPRAGHLSMLAAPRPVADRILRFVASLAPGSRTP